ncbi:O-antigen polysaccharide polymerase Wzy [Schleiferiaceae bacterium]|nr:O-antigen polysaccharide polymerase Wzy [Schleiferiaceae bacterium]
MEVLLLIIFALFIRLEYNHLIARKALSFSSVFLVSYVGLFIVPIAVLGINNADMSFLEYFYKDEIIYEKSKRMITIVLLQAFIGTYVGRRLRLAGSNRMIFGIGKSYMPIINVITGFTLLLYVMMSGDMIYGEYTPENTIAGRTYVYRLFFVFYNIGIINYLFSKGSKRAKMIFMLIMLFFLALSLFIGDRGPLVVTALYFSAWASKKGFWNLRRIVVIGFVGVFMLGIIGAARSQRRNETSVMNRYSKSLSLDFTNYGVGEGPLFELARSTKCLTAAIEDVELNGIKYGFFHSVYLTATVPFLSNIYLQFLDRDTDRYGSSSSYFTYLIQGTNPSYGNGTNIIADLYIDFGEVLTYLIVFIFFFFIAGFEAGFYRSNYLTIEGVIFLVFYSVSFYLPRGSVFMQLEKISLILLLIFTIKGLKFEKS